MSPNILSSERKSRIISVEWMSSEKFDIRWTCYSEMSSENSNCPARDWRFAEQMSGEAQMNFAYSEFQDCVTIKKDDSL